MSHPQQDIAHTLSNGIIGTATTVLGVLTSFQEDLEFWLRVLSLLVGLSIGVVTLWNLIKAARKK
jgi:hypothetical protein